MRSMVHHSIGAAAAADLDIASVVETVVLAEVVVAQSVQRQEEQGSIMDLQEAEV